MAPVTTIVSLRSNSAANVAVLKTRTIMRARINLRFIYDTPSLFSSILTRLAMVRPT